MPYAIRVHEYGGPDVLRWEEVEAVAPGPGDARVRHTAVGLNFIDVYERTGLYKSALPLILGREAAGVVDAVGSAVKHVQVGDRVAYSMSGAGAYCELRVLPADRLIRIPDAIEDQQAAALMLKGLTAQVLLRQVWRLRKTDTALIHAAAGGVGSILVQWAKHIGATVIAVVGSQEKAAYARELRADYVLQSGDDWAAEIKSLTRGRGASVVYDSVGQDTFTRSLDCLRPRGMMVTYGNSSGPVAPVAPLELARRGSLFMTRPVLFDYVATRSALVRAAQELLDLAARAVITIKVGQTYALQDAARAHRDLEARRTMGSTVLTL